MGERQNKRGGCPIIPQVKVFGRLELRKTHVLFRHPNFKVEWSKDSEFQLIEKITALNHDQKRVLSVTLHHGFLFDTTEGLVLNKESWYLKVKCLKDSIVFWKLTQFTVQDWSNDRPL